MVAESLTALFPAPLRESAIHIRSLADNWGKAGDRGIGRHLAAPWLQIDCNSHFIVGTLTSGADRNKSSRKRCEMRPNDALAAIVNGLRPKLSWIDL
jgi:hypothetical protein